MCLPTSILAGSLLESSGGTRVGNCRPCWAIVLEGEVEADRAPRVPPAAGGRPARWPRVWEGTRSLPAALAAREHAAAGGAASPRCRLQCVLCVPAPGGCGGLKGTPQPPWGVGPGDSTSV